MEKGKQIYCFWFAGWAAERPIIKRCLFVDLSRDFSIDDAHGQVWDWHNNHGEFWTKPVDSAVERIRTLESVLPRRWGASKSSIAYWDVVITMNTGRKKELEWLSVKVRVHVQLNNYKTTNGTRTS